MIDFFKKIPILLIKTFFPKLDRNVEYSFLCIIFLKKKKEKKKKKKEKKRLVYHYCHITAIAYSSKWFVKLFHK